MPIFCCRLRLLWALRRHSTSLSMKRAHKTLQPCRMRRTSLRSLCSRRLHKHHKWTIQLDPSTLWSMTLHSISVVVQVTHLLFLDHSRWDFVLNYWCCWGKLDAPKTTWSKWKRCISLSICMLFYYYRETNKLAKSHCNCLLDFWGVIQFFFI